VLCASGILRLAFLTWGKYTPGVNFIFLGGTFIESLIMTNKNFKNFYKTLYTRLLGELVAGQNTKVHPTLFCS